MAGIVFVAKFVQANNEAFCEYIDYMKRSEAVETSDQHTFSKYSEYMSNHEKTTGLFDYFENNLSDNQIKKHQEIFEHAQESSGLMWQQVISFTPEFLKENNIEIDGVIDDQKLKDVTRKVMTQQLKDEGMLHNVCWNAAIHYNTDNIHIHIAFVERNPTRTRGKIKQSTFERAKSEIFKGIVDRTAEMNEMNEQKKQLIASAKELKGAIQFGSYIESLDKIIPKRGRMQYNSSHITDAQRAIIDSFSKKLFESALSTEYNAYMQNVYEESNVYHDAYGERKNGNQDEFIYNKEKELYARVGNNMLHTLKEYRKLMNELENKNKQTNDTRKQFMAKVKLQKFLKQQLKEQMKTREYEIELADRALLGE